MGLNCSFRFINLVPEFNGFLKSFLQCFNFVTCLDVVTTSFFMVSFLMVTDLPGKEPGHILKQVGLVLPATESKQDRARSERIDPDFNHFDGLVVLACEKHGSPSVGSVYEDRGHDLGFSRPWRSCNDGQWTCEGLLHCFPLFRVQGKRLQQNIRCEGWYPEIGRSHHSTMPRVRSPGVDYLILPGVLPVPVLALLYKVTVLIRK